MSSSTRLARIGIVAVVAVMVLAAAVYGGLKAFGGPPDYRGDGLGTVVVSVPKGSDGWAIAELLQEADVVKSTEAFYQEAVRDERAATIRPGVYRLHRQMSASAALDALLDPANRQENAVTITEGSRLSKIVATIDAQTDFSAAEVTAVLDHPAPLGLPPSAAGNPEGYLFPATYVVEPGMTVTELLVQMVDKTKQVADKLHIAERASELGLSYEQVLTMASILEWEANGSAEDRRKIARVFYNRLDQAMALQSDATVSYANDTEGEIWTTPQQRANPSAYNTYQHVGLPPGPIGSPGEDSIEAALNPADGPWLYFTLLDLDKGTTAFAVTLAEHEQNVEKFRQYCRGTDAC